MWCLIEEREKIRRVEQILNDKMVDFEEDERRACVKLWRGVAKRRRVGGRPESWAAAVYYTYCRMVFKEGVSAKAVEELFKVSQGTITSKCTEIRNLLNLGIFDKRFTPARLYAESPVAELEESLAQILELGAVDSLFEVKEKVRKKVLLVDLRDGGEYLVKDKTALQRLDVGNVVSATIFPYGDFYVLSGEVRVYDLKDDEQRALIKPVIDYYTGKSDERVMDIQRDLCEACREYFGSTDPVFKNAREAEKALDDFMSWYRNERELPGKGETPAKLYLEDHGKLPDISVTKFPRELHEAGEIGVVFDEIGGIYILPRYGQIKELFRGDFKKVLDHNGLVRALVTEEGFVPSFLIRRLINENPDQAVRVFASAYRGVKTLQDILKLLEKHRTDWNKKPKPSVIPIM